MKKYLVLQVFSKSLSIFVKCHWFWTKIVISRVGEEHTDTRIGGLGGGRWRVAVWRFGRGGRGREGGIREKWFGGVVEDGGRREGEKGELITYELDPCR